MLMRKRARCLQSRAALRRRGSRAAGVRQRRSAGMAEVAKLEKKPEPKVDAEWCSIHKALPQITGAIPPITKARKNTQQSYASRGVDDVYAVLNLLLEKFGVTIIPEVIKAKRESY